MLCLKHGFRVECKIVCDMDVAVLIAVAIGIVITSAYPETSKGNTSIPFLEVSLYSVDETSVEIDWHSRTIRSENLASCELLYGPANNPDHLQLLSDFLPESHTFRLSGLHNNVTYNFHMICRSKMGSTLESNILKFTTGTNVHSQNFINMISSNLQKSEHNSAKDGLYTADESSRTIQSSSVILGAICGIVGFLIINVTVVMAVRRYSHHQIRRRRILEIEERDYDEFPYLERFE